MNQLRLIPNGNTKRPKLLMDILPYSIYTVGYREDNRFKYEIRAKLQVPDVSIEVRIANMFNYFNHEMYPSTGSNFL